MRKLGNWTAGSRGLSLHTASQGTKGVWRNNSLLLWSNFDPSFCIRILQVLSAILSSRRIALCYRLSCNLVALHSVEDCSEVRKLDTQVLFSANKIWMTKHMPYKPPMPTSTIDCAASPRALMRLGCDSRAGQALLGT